MRTTFSLPLYALHQGLIVLGIATRPPWLRFLLFIAIAMMSYQLVFRSTIGVAGIGLGSGILSQLLFAFDYLVLTDVHSKLHRRDEKPGHIISAPFKERLAWAWHLFNSPRGVGWAHELLHLPQDLPLIKTGDRKAFVKARLFEALCCLIVQIIGMVINAANPALVPGAPPLFNQSLYMKTVSMLGLGVCGAAQTTILHCLAGALLVGIGISRPADWPPLFGSFKNMYTVQRFWSHVWHQLLRRPLVTSAVYIIHNVLRIPRVQGRSPCVLGLLKLHTAFFLSALVHIGGEYMVLGRGGSGSFYFFVLQGWAITVETALRYLVTGAAAPSKHEPPLHWRIIGYVWVLYWFVRVTPLIQQPMVDGGVFAGQFGSALTESVRQLLALEVH